VENALGLPFPPDLKASWMLHNGTTPQFLGGWYLMSLKQILQTIQVGRSIEEWSSNWLPFAESESGTMLCVELDPGQREAEGRIICFDPAFGATIVAPDFWHLMSWFVNDLLDGAYEVNAAGHLWSEDVSLGS
jgi:cell wall assembly regulator SMI1